MKGLAQEAEVLRKIDHFESASRVSSRATRTASTTNAEKVQFVPLISSSTCSIRLFGNRMLLFVVDGNEGLYASQLCYRMCDKCIIFSAMGIHSQWNGVPHKNFYLTIGESCLHEIDRVKILIYNLIRECLKSFGTLWQSLYLERQGD